MATLERLLEVLLRGEKRRSTRSTGGCAASGIDAGSAVRTEEPGDTRSLMLRGRVYTDRQEFAEAETALRDALEVTQATLGSDHLQAADARFFIGRLYIAKGQHAEAQDWFEQALAIREKTLGPDSLPVAQALTSIGDCIASGGNFRDAIRICVARWQLTNNCSARITPTWRPALGRLGRICVTTVTTGSEHPARAHASDL